MNITDFLSPSHVLMDLAAASKAGLLNELAGRAAAVLNLSPADVSDAITKRDELGSTGIGHGVSMPHARLPDVKKPFGLFARLKSPIEFDAIDEHPVDLVFFLLLPAASQLGQLNALAAVARRLRQTGVLARLRSASTRNEIYRALTA